jgi:hypothetical protein
MSWHIFFYNLGGASGYGLSTVRVVPSYCLSSLKSKILMSCYWGYSALLIGLYKR